MNMRILLVTHYSLPHVGGIEVLLDTMSRAFTERGHQVAAVSSGLPARETVGDVELFRVPAVNVLERWLDVPYPIFAPSLVSLLRREIQRADVVHVHGVLYAGSLCSLYWSSLLRKPLVVTEHVGFVPYRSRFLNSVQKMALWTTAQMFLRRADAVVTYNSSVRSWMHTMTPYPERLRFVPNGIDTKIFRPAESAEEKRAARLQFGIKADGPIALFVGRFVEKKGLDTLLRLTDTDFGLVLCGSGTLPAIADQGRITVLRNIPHDCMPEVYRAADVFVMPSRGEGFPVAIMEAMSCGLPVVAVRDTSYQIYVTDTEMVQTDPNPTSLHAGLTCVLSLDDSELQRRRAAARKRAIEEFSLDTCIARHLAIYDEVQRSNKVRRWQDDSGI